MLTAHKAATQSEKLRKQPSPLLDRSCPIPADGVPVNPGFALA